MGFFTGFFAGFALTTSVLYITIQTHQTNRINQRNTIREQVQTLNWTSSPVGAYDRRFIPQDQDPRRSTEYGTYRREPPTTKDMLKHRWNKEVETLVRKAHESRWEDARETVAEGWNAAMKYVKRE
ncbi:MICOS complex subunit Mic12 family protein [Aspergillus chevalieri]|uniref:MICOS complex subunit MIC12 n=1 Tax=Aspergillus chevalieri TaxID=182096 RepID=A0A7R7VLV9_ASPCH|nr:uncharacterized protein ACHE_30941A [Aspergillus chevalieri]BCR86954.1 hypothetical protein ACHE_30941A [Aspergillus chevalieri]